MGKINKNQLSVLISGVGGGSHGEQILKALRLSDLQYEIIGCDIDSTSKGLAEVDKAYIVPRATDPDFLDVTLDICCKHNIKAVFHGSEIVMMKFAEAREQFAVENIYLPINPDSVLETCQDKVKTAQFLRDNGFKVPEFMEITSAADFLAFNKYPAVIKPAVQGGGSAHVHIVQSHEELKTFGQYLLKLFGKFIIQEYCGSPDQEYTVGVLFGSDGTFLNSIAVRRIINNAMSMSFQVENRTSRKELGKTLVISSGISQGEIGQFVDITSTCESIAINLKPTAPINIQCRVVKGEVVPFEINPRFSGTTSLRAMVGFNEPDILIRRDVLCEKIETRFEYEECVIMRGLQEVKVSRDHIMKKTGILLGQKLRKKSE